MTDQECAEVLRRYQPGPGVPSNPDWVDYDAAVERAIELLEREAATSEAQRVHREWNAKYGWSAKHPTTNAPRSTSAPKVHDG